MSGFLYYIPGRRALDPADLPKLGLGHLLDEPERSDQSHVGLTRREVNAGPDNQGAGLVVGVGGGPVGYWPEHQRWELLHAPASEGDGQPAVYVGYYPDAPPGPDGLARSKQIPGHNVELGHPPAEWVVPAVRSVVRSDDPVPAVLTLNGDGHWHRQPLERYRRITEFADRVYETVMLDAATQAGEGDRDDDSPAPITDQDAAWAAAEALSINYRVSAAEVSALGLLRTDRFWDPDGPLLALIDWPTFMSVARELEKKDGPATPAGSSTSSG